MANKITKKEVINAMLANEVIRSNSEWVDYLKNELALLDKKSAYRQEKAAEKQIANAELKASVIASLSDKGQTVTEIHSNGSFPADTSPQRITYILTQLVKDGIVEKNIEKRKSFYRIASE